MGESEIVNEWRREGQQQSIQIVLEERFGQVPADFLARLATVNVAERLDQLLRQAIRASRLDELSLYSELTQIGHRGG